MAKVAGIRDFQRIGFTRRNEAESVASHVNIRNSLLDFGHMARYAVAAGASRSMVGVLDERRPAWTVG